MSSLGPPDEPLPAIDKYITHGCQLPSDEDLDVYSIPTITDLGLLIPEESTEVLYPGGEVEALRRMDEYMAKKVSLMLIQCQFVIIKFTSYFIYRNRTGCANLKSQILHPTQ